MSPSCVRNVKHPFFNTDVGIGGQALLHFPDGREVRCHATLTQDVPQAGPSHTLPYAEVPSEIEYLDVREMEDGLEVGMFVGNVRTSTDAVMWVKDS